MKKLAKRLSVMTLSALFASMQMVSASVANFDTGLGNGLGGAVINNATGGLTGVDKGTNSATLNFNNSAHVNWDSLNVNKNETLNFNGSASGITVLNSVNGGMSYIYGKVNSTGIDKLIISNPSGMLYDGATFTSTGDVNLTTQPMALNGSTPYILEGKLSEGLNTITIKDSNFNVGGEFNITASAINAINSIITPGKAFKLSTIDGQNFTANAINTDKFKKGVKLQSVTVNGDIYITTADGLVDIIDGGTVKGSLNVNTPGAVYELADGKKQNVKGGNVNLNVDNTAKNKLDVTGDITVKSNSSKVFIHNTKTGGKINAGNVGGSVEVVNIVTGGDVNLVTKKDGDTKPKHFVHVGGNNDIGGDLNIDSVHNIHIGGYNEDHQVIDGKNWGTKVGGSVNATAHRGSVAVLKDLEAGEKINLTSGTLNIITNGKAVMKAKEYNFKADKYIGGLNTDEEISSTMEGYVPIYPNSKTYVTIDGGKVNKLEAPYAFVKANNSMELNNINGKMINLTAGDYIKIGDNANAELIQVEGDTKTLEVVNSGRNYLLDYKNIRDNARIKIEGKEVITAEMANGKTGLNVNPNGRPNKTTYLVAPFPAEPEEPVVPPVNPDPEPPVTPSQNPDDNNENIKILKNLNRDRTASAIDANQVYTPVAFAADLDEEIDNAVRKNVDGSVTVVRPFTPIK